MRLTAEQARQLGITCVEAGPAPEPAAKPKRPRPQRQRPAREPIGPRERVLVLDVSSVCTGWAVFTGPHPERFGRVKQASKVLTERIGAMVDAIGAIARTEAPHRIVLEWASKGANVGRGGHGLTSLGQAQGAVYQALRGLGVPLVAVEQWEWTDFVPKATRAKLVRQLVPQYATVPDRGGDVGDALGLGLWLAGRWPKRERTSRRRATR